MFMNEQQVENLVRAALAQTTAQFEQQIGALNQQIQELQPPVVEELRPVTIDPAVAPGNASLDLIKSLPEFSGDVASYPAWRSAAVFAMDYYPLGSEKCYVATGILRNKITNSANATLSAFNTVLNVKAILRRLDQSYSDKRPIHVLENELSVLRQENLTISEFYDAVDKQLTLIINKQIMSHSGNDQLIAAFSDNARENALRVFISGLRRPLCDILFSARPKDLPSALATAQELETNHKRQLFAKAFATGNSMKDTKPQIQNKVFQFPKPFHNNTQSPMDIDPTLVLSNHRSNGFNRARFQQNVGVAGPSNFHQPNLSSNPKRLRDASSRAHINKIQRVNYMADANTCEDQEVEDDSSEISDYENISETEDNTHDDVHFLG